RRYFNVEVRNISYGNKVHTMTSKKSTNYSTYFMNQGYKKSQMRTYRGDVPSPVAATWKLKSVFRSQFRLQISTQPPKVYKGSQQLEYKFDLNDTLMLERNGWTHLIRNKTFPVKPRQITQVTLTVREATKV
ncbi:unnamed protein product, partial [Ixodes hexagonus]